MSRVPFIARRVVGMIAVLAVLLVGTFVMVRLFHADPARQVAGPEADPQLVAQVRAELGLNQPIWVQFAQYADGVLHGDFGSSYEAPFAKLPVARVIGETFPWTAALAGVATLMVVLFSVPIGLVSGILTRDNRHRRFTLVFTGGASAIASIPAFLLATFLSAVFAVWLALLPVGAGPDTPVWEAIILPATALALGDIFILARIIRVETLNVLAQDYIRTARSKRLPAHVLYLRHVLPNVLTAALTLGGSVFASLIAGAVIVENVFDWPGMGTKLVSAILVGDYPVIQACVLILGTAVIVINTAVDLALGFLDPRTLNR
jgi:peptide/nickel transport system permease protein